MFEFFMEKLLTSILAAFIYLMCAYFSALLLLQFAASVCDGAEPGPPAQCVRITVGDKGGMTSSATGTYIGDRLVITCYHIVRERAKGGAIFVLFPSGEKIAGELVRTWPEQEIATIRLEESPRCPPMALGASLTNGEALTIHGYGTGTYRAAQGVLSERRYGDKKKGPEITWFKVSDAIARSGDSGGPVTGLGDRNIGVFLGVLWGAYEGDGTYFTPIDWIMENVKGAGRQVAPEDVLEYDLVPEPTYLFYMPRSE
jgi:S1-C subfamily serine protease